MVYSCCRIAGIKSTWLKHCEPTVFQQSNNPSKKVSTNLIADTKTHPPQVWGQIKHETDHLICEIPMHGFCLASRVIRHTWMINQIYHVISLETLQHQSRKKKIITEKGKKKSNNFAHIVLVSLQTQQKNWSRPERRANWGDPRSPSNFQTRGNARWRGKVIGTQRKEAT
jgi:hypothetical protein